MQNKNPVNGYGDLRVLAGDGHHGIDVARQRADDLDKAAIEHLGLLTAGGTIPHAVDLGCGSGGQVERMAALGAEVLGIDISDQREAFIPIIGRVRFMQYDLTQLVAKRPRLPLAPFDLVISQRVLHYFPYAVACKILSQFRRHYMTPEARLYVSASGLLSELGEGYGARNRDIAVRFHELAPTMRDKHGIQGPVCLYTPAELAGLVEEAGFSAMKAYRSDFGNAKVIARMR